MAISQEDRNIGENIKLYRILAGLSRKGLSRRIERTRRVVITPAVIKACETGNASISAIRLHQIAAALGIDVNLLYEDADPSLLVNAQGFRLLESFHTIPHRSAKDALLHLARMLAQG